MNEEQRKRGEKILEILAGKRKKGSTEREFGADSYLGRMSRHSRVVDFRSGEYKAFAVKFQDLKEAAEAFDDVLRTGDVDDVDFEDMVDVLRESYAQTSTELSINDTETYKRAKLKTGVFEDVAETFTGRDIKNIGELLSKDRKPKAFDVNKRTFGALSVLAEEGIRSVGRIPIKPMLKTAKNLLNKTLFGSIISENIPEPSKEKLHIPFMPGTGIAKMIDEGRAEGVPWILGNSVEAKDFMKNKQRRVAHKTLYEIAKKEGYKGSYADYKKQRPLSGIDDNVISNVNNLAGKYGLPLVPNEEQLLPLVQTMERDKTVKDNKETMEAMSVDPEIQKKVLSGEYTLADGFGDFLGRKAIPKFGAPGVRELRPVYPTSTITQIANMVNMKGGIFEILAKSFAMGSSFGKDDAPVSGTEMVREIEGRNEKLLNDREQLAKDLMATGIASGLDMFDLFGLAGKIMKIPKLAKVGVIRYLDKIIDEAHGLPKVEKNLDELGNVLPGLKQAESRSKASKILNTIVDKKFMASLEDFIQVSEKGFRSGDDIADSIEILTGMKVDDSLRVGLKHRTEDPRNFENSLAAQELFQKNLEKYSKKLTLPLMRDKVIGNIKSLKEFSLEKRVIQGPREAKVKPYEYAIVAKDKDGKEAKFVVEKLDNGMFSITKNGEIVGDSFTGKQTKEYLDKLKDLRVTLPPGKPSRTSLKGLPGKKNDIIEVPLTSKGKESIVDLKTPKPTKIMTPISSFKFTTPDGKKSIVRIFEYGAVNNLGRKEKTITFKVISDGIVKEETLTESNFTRVFSRGKIEPIEPPKKGFSRTIDDDFPKTPEEIEVPKSEEVKVEDVKVEDSKGKKPKTPVEDKPVDEPKHLTELRDTVPFTDISGNGHLGFKYKIGDRDTYVEVATIDGSDWYRVFDSSSGKKIGEGANLEVATKNSKFTIEDVKSEGSKGKKRGKGSKTKKTKTPVEAKPVDKEPPVSTVLDESKSPEELRDTVPFEKTPEGQALDQKLKHAGYLEEIKKGEKVDDAIVAELKGKGYLKKDGSISKKGDNLVKSIADEGGGEISKATTQVQEVSSKVDTPPEEPHHQYSSMNVKVEDKVKYKGGNYKVTGIGDDLILSPTAKPKKGSSPLAITLTKENAAKAVDSGDLFLHQVHVGEGKYKNVSKQSGSVITTPEFTEKIKIEDPHLNLPNINVKTSYKYKSDLLDLFGGKAKDDERVTSSIGKLADGNLQRMQLAQGLDKKYKTPANYGIADRFGSALTDTKGSYRQSLDEATKLFNDGKINEGNVHVDAAIRIAADEFFEATKKTIFTSDTNQYKDISKLRDKIFNSSFSDKMPKNYLKAIETILDRFEKEGWRLGTMRDALIDSFTKMSVAPNKDAYYKTALSNMAETLEEFAKKYTRGPVGFGGTGTLHNEWQRWKKQKFSKEFTKAKDEWLKSEGGVPEISQGPPVVPKDSKIVPKVDEGAGVWPYLYHLAMRRDYGRLLAAHGIKDGYAFKAITDAGEIATYMMDQSSYHGQRAVRSLFDKIPKGKERDLVYNKVNQFLVDRDSGFNVDVSSLDDVSQGIVKEYDKLIKVFKAEMLKHMKETERFHTIWWLKHKHIAFDVAESNEELLKKAKGFSNQWNWRKIDWRENYFHRRKKAYNMVIRLPLKDGDVTVGGYINKAQAEEGLTKAVAQLYLKDKKIKYSQYDSPHHIIALAENNGFVYDDYLKSILATSEKTKEPLRPIIEAPLGKKPSLFESVGPEPKITPPQLLEREDQLLDWETDLFKSMDAYISGHYRKIYGERFTANALDAYLGIKDKTVIAAANRASEIISGDLHEYETTVSRMLGKYLGMNVNAPVAKALASSRMVQSMFKVIASPVSWALNLLQLGETGARVGFLRTGKAMIEVEKDLAIAARLDPVKDFDKLPEKLKLLMTHLDVRTLPSVTTAEEFAKGMKDSLTYKGIGIPLFNFGKSDELTRLVTQYAWVDWYNEKTAQAVAQFKPGKGLKKGEFVNGKGYDWWAEAAKQKVPAFAPGSDPVFSKHTFNMMDALNSTMYNYSKFNRLMLATDAVPHTLVGHLATYTYSRMGVEARMWANMMKVQREMNKRGLGKKTWVRYFYDPDGVNRELDLDVVIHDFVQPHQILKKAAWDVAVGGIRGSALGGFVYAMFKKQFDAGFDNIEMEIERDRFYGQERYKGLIPTIRKTFEDRGPIAALCLTPYALAKKFDRNFHDRQIGYTILEFVRGGAPSMFNLNLVDRIAVVGTRNFEFDSYISPNAQILLHFGRIMKNQGKPAEFRKSVKDFSLALSPVMLLYAYNSMGEMQRLIGNKADNWELVKDIDAKGFWRADHVKHYEKLAKEGKYSSMFNQFTFDATKVILSLPDAVDKVSEMLGRVPGVNYFVGGSRPLEKYVMSYYMSTASPPLNTMRPFLRLVGLSHPNQFEYKEKLSDIKEVTGIIRVLQDTFVDNATSVWNRVDLDEKEKIRRIELLVKEYSKASKDYSVSFESIKNKIQNSKLAYVVFMQMMKNIGPGKSIPIMIKAKNNNFLFKMFRDAKIPKEKYFELEKAINATEEYLKDKEKE